MGKYSWYGYCLAKLSGMSPAPVMKEKSETGRKKKEAPARPEKADKSSAATTTKEKAAAKMKEKSSSTPPKAAAGGEAVQMKKSGPTSRRRRVSVVATSPARPGYAEVAIAAYLNWCDRRKQNLPDDAFADWIAAESEMGLVN